MLTVITPIHPARDLKLMLVMKRKTLPSTVSPFSPKFVLNRFNLDRPQPLCLRLVPLNQLAEQFSTNYVLKRKSKNHLKEESIYIEQP